MTKKHPDLRYLQFNIFGLAVKDMAIKTGTLSKRVAGVYERYLYKIHWNQVLEFIPEDLQENFLGLKKLIKTEEKNVSAELEIYKAKFGKKTYHG